MLIELYGKNFGCFRDEFHLSMLATPIDPDSDRGIIEAHINGEDEPLRLLRSVAIYGANASGKSTVLRAAHALANFIKTSGSTASDQPLQYYEPFALGVDTNRPVMLGMKAVIDQVVYDYFIEYGEAEFLRERLTRLGAEPESILIDRVGELAGGTWKEHEQFELLTKAFRRNALILSLADSITPEIASSIAVGLRRLLTGGALSSTSEKVGAQEHAAKRAFEDRYFNEWLLNRLKSADVGVVGLKSKPTRRMWPTPGADGRMRFRIRNTPRLVLMHEGEEGPVPLPYSRESLGTQRLVEIAPLLFDLMSDKSNPHTMASFVDELDTSMHPLLVEDIIRHLNCDLTRSQICGQLIFTTHETALLDGEAKDAVLRRDQIYFTEKDAAGASRLFSVAEFKERNNLNVRRRYLQGRYGALPSLGTVSE